jgi:hypothetical protein
MTNPYYAATGGPSQHTNADATLLQNEFAAIESGFNKLPVLTGKAGNLVVVNSTEDGLDSIPQAIVNSILEGSGYYVFKDKNASNEQFIIQWVGGTANSTGVLTIPWPIQFPNSFLGGLVVGDFNQLPNNQLLVWGLNFAGCNTTTAVAHIRSITGASSSPTNTGLDGKVAVVFGWGK